MATIKGKWVFNDELQYGKLCGTGLKTIDVNFTSNGQQFWKMVADGDDWITSSSRGLWYIPVNVTDNKDGVYAFKRNDGWSDTAYCEVDFGTTEQTVSDEFYTWLTDNATDVTATQTLISGVWKFNEILSPLLPGQFYVSFISNGVEFSSMKFITCGCDEHLDIVYTSISLDNPYVSVYCSCEDSYIIDDFEKIGWQEEALRTVDFGSVERYVDDIFYTWLTANATRQAEPEPEAPTTGKVNVTFNGTTYSIDTSALESAATTLKTHLTSNMSGTGATIKLGGVSYNIDSTKLANARTKFVTHLGSIAGTGTKVKVNGVEYGIDTAKIADAVAELHEVLGGMVSGGSISNYRTQATEYGTTVIIKSYSYTPNDFGTTVII